MVKYAERLEDRFAGRITHQKRLKSAEGLALVAYLVYYAVEGG